MVRESLATDASHVSAVVHGDGLTSLQYRQQAKAETEERKCEPKLRYDSLNARRKYLYHVRCPLGETFVSEKVVSCTLPDDVYVGLFISSHNADVSEKAIFKNVRIEIPFGEEKVAYRDYLGSNLEIMDVFTGERQNLRQYSNSVQAPNWTPDGKTLIYNSEGLLYNYDLATGKYRF